MVGWLYHRKEISCPETTADMRLLTNERHDYRLLCPVGYKVEKPSEMVTVLVVSSLLNAEDPRVNILVEDAGGRTADELAQQIAADFEDFPIERGSVVLGGVEAILLDKVPGQDINRQVIVVHDDQLYRLTFMPADGQVGEVCTQMESLYTTVIDSFRRLSAGEHGDGFTQEELRCINSTRC
jgi:hypothetical protein